MIYLNDVEKGGRTNFPLQEISFKPTAGTLIYWPAGYGSEDDEELVSNSDDDGANES